jgi:hypothetical protein
MPGLTEDNAVLAMLTGMRDDIRQVRSGQDGLSQRLGAIEGKLSSVERLEARVDELNEDLGNVRESAAAEKAELAVLRSDMGMLKKWLPWVLAGLLGTQGATGLLRGLSQEEQQEPPAIAAPAEPGPGPGPGSGPGALGVMP